MKSIKTCFSILLFLLIVNNTSAQSIESQFDILLNEQYPKDGPGATVLVAKKGEIIYQKAFGLANMELNVPMQPDMKLEIGSITKQFTAVAILMLKEEGKISLDDEITKFIEDYPTHGHKITIHHLLTHTSGIKSYTSMKEWQPVWRKDFEPLELIDFFKKEPMDFAPGDKFLYNNSAYFILGYIIEKASGITYEDFVETKIFQPLGMNSSLYGSKKELIINRAPGYKKEEKFMNADYLSMSQPGAAGSLMSTVADLYKWNRALLENKLVKKETLDLAYKNYTLNNGEKINYGYGWFFNEINGSPTIEHSGGIFGYITNAIYLPNEDVFVAIFTNCDCNSPGQVSTKMAAIAIKKPYLTESSIIKVKDGALEDFVGFYEFEDGLIRYITLEENQLYSQRKGGSKVKIFPTKGNVFFYENSLSTITFSKNGKAINVIFKNRNDEIKGVKTDKPIPTKESIEVSQEQLKKYVGVYNLAPNFDITISLEDGKMMSQATGQAKFEIFSETKTKFFLKVVDAQIEFLANEKGDYDSFMLYQGGQEIKGKRK